MVPIVFHKKIRCVGNARCKRTSCGAKGRKVLDICEIKRGESVLSERKPGPNLVPEFLCLFRRCQRPTAFVPNQRTSESKEESKDEVTEKSVHFQIGSILLRLYIHYGCGLSFCFA